MSGRPPLTNNAAARMQLNPPAAIASVPGQAQPTAALRITDQARSSTPVATPIASPASITNASGSNALGQRAPAHCQNGSDVSYVHPVPSSAVSANNSSSVPRSSSSATTVPHPSTASAIASRISALHAAEANKRYGTASTGPPTSSVYTLQQQQQPQRQRQPHQQLQQEQHNQALQAQPHQPHQIQQQQYNQQVNMPQAGQPFASSTVIQNHPPRQHHSSNAPPSNRYTGYQQPPAVKVEPRTSAVAAYEMTDLSLSQFDFDPDGDSTTANKRLRT